MLENMVNFRQINTPVKAVRNRCGYSKILIFDIMRMRRCAGVCFANDLMACYDRMAHVPSSLALRFLGAPPRAVECMSNTIQQMRHHIRTAYGDSDHSYGGDANNLLQGGGQGSPAAPPM